MKRYISVLAVISCMAMLAAGCSSETEGTLSPSDSTMKHDALELPEYQAKLNRIQPTAYNNAKGLELEPGSYISIIGKRSSGEFWEEMQAGIEQAAEDLNTELGYEGDDKVRVKFMAPSDSVDVDEQVNLLDEELDLYPAALAISIVDVKSCEVQFDLAYQNGIPIIAFDSSSGYGGFSAEVSTNNEQAAQKAADQLAEAVGEKGNVIIFTTDLRSESMQTRVKAFKEQIKTEYPEMKVTKVYNADNLAALKKKIAKKIHKGKYQRLDGSGSPVDEEGKELTEDDISDEDVVDYIIAKTGDVAGCFATNADMTEYALKTMQHNQITDAKIVGFDVTDNIKQAIQDGTITGVIMQNPFGMGYATVIAACRSALGMGNQASIDSQFVWVDAQSIQTEKIQSLMY